MSWWWSSNALDLSLQGPREEAVNVVNRARGSAETDDNAEWMYELQLVKPLPIVDISGTPLMKMLSPSRYSKMGNLMHRVTPFLVRLNRVNILVFGSVLFLPATITRPWIPLLGAISLIPPLVFTLFFSLEILALLRGHYEYWFVSVLNVVNWIGVGQIFGDFRAVVCVSFWLNSQNVISIDANYRTYQTTTKSIIMAGPSMIALVVCCSYRLIIDSASPSVSIGTVVLHWHQIVIFTASTLVIFMFKKAYAKTRRHRRQIRNTASSNIGGDQHIISCVVLSARMRLVPSTNKQHLRLTNFITDQPATASNTQQLRLRCHGSYVIDGRRVFLPESLLVRCLSPFMRFTLCVVAITGLAATAAAWGLLLYQSEHALMAAVVAFSFSVVFVLPTAALTQKELLRLLAQNFDVLFTTAQATVLGFCLMDLLQWRASSSIAVVTWWIWFLWILMLDALTPSVSHQLRLRKLAQPVIFLVLSVAAACAVCIVTGDNELFKTRLLFTLNLPELGTYHEYTGSLAVQRVVTIIGWNARILFESDPKQLIFIRRGVEYASPFRTFSEPLSRRPQPEPRRIKQRCWKQPRSGTISPQGTANTSQGPN